MAARLRPARLIALDQSRALLDTVAKRMRLAGHPADTVLADFHNLPLQEASVDVFDAAFCLYHSPRPDDVIAEIGRCIAPGGRAVLVTKSADSYHEIDQLVAASGLDPESARRLSLYSSFHGDNAPDIICGSSRRSLENPGSRNPSPASVSKYRVETS